MEVLVPTKIPQRERRLAIITTGVVIVVAAVLWLNRWHLSRTAVTIADPMIRAWVSQQVLESSDSVYHLVASTIRVDESRRRLVIDTITLTTDADANGRLARPHPAVTMRFSRCAVTGIDLSTLSAGQGLHAVHAGCDSVSITERTLVASREGPEGPGSEKGQDDFLRFQGKVELPRSVPFIAVDTVAFPHVHVSFDLLGADGRRTALAVDSIAVALDSLRIDPRQAVAKRRPLFSRDITVRIDRFEGSTNAAAHVALQHLRANLDRGTCELDSLIYEPSPGRRTDSTGFTAVRADHVYLEHVDWRAFLLNGDVGVGRLAVDGVHVRAVAPANLPGRLLYDVTPRHLENTLRDAGRNVRLDALVLTSLTLIQAPARRSDSMVTTIDRLDASGVAYGPRDQDWRTAFPVGRIRVTLDGVVRKAANSRLAIEHAEFQAVEQRLTVRGLRSEPPGNDAAFVARYPFRKSRFALRIPRIELRGADLPAYLTRGAVRANAIEAHDFTIDVLNDKSKPTSPDPKVRRTPQQVMRDLRAELAIDTLLADGMVSYRERDPAAVAPGTLTFGALRLRGYNFSTDPAHGQNAGVLRLLGDAKLMGEGAMHVEWTVPLISKDFAMRWHGTLGRMKASALNAFLQDAVGMRFNGGMIDGVEWDAVVANGMARGKFVPRWHDLHVELPGVARGDGGVVGGISRGLAKFAANAFGIRSNNDTLPGHQPLDASITHQWTNIETLPQFTWLQLRQPLMLILKK